MKQKASSAEVKGFGEYGYTEFDSDPDSDFDPDGCGSSESAYLWITLLVALNKAFIS